MKLQLFRIKDGKYHQWREWCEYLELHKEEVRETLKQENCVREACMSLGPYVIGIAEFDGDPMGADLNIPLNVEHRRQLEECLEKMEWVTLYDISTDVESA